MDRTGAAVFVRAGDEHGGASGDGVVCRPLRNAGEGIIGMLWGQ